MAEKVVLGYWPLRAKAQVAQTILEFAGAEYEIKRYTFDNTQEWFGNDKPNLGLQFPNLPYILHGDVKLTETLAIWRYLCRQFAPDLLGKTPEEQTTVDELLYFLKAVERDPYNTCYRADYEDVLADVLTKAKTKLAHLENFAGDKQFLLGAEVSLPDLVFTEFGLIADLVGISLAEEFPRLSAIRERVNALEFMEKFRGSDRYIEKGLVGPNAPLRDF